MKDIGIQLVDHTDGDDVLDLKIEVKRDSAGEKIVQGFVIGNTLQQNIGMLLIAQPGEIKAYPDLGIGLADMTLDTEMLAYRHRIREQFPKDGLNITKLDLYPSIPVAIEAEYA